MALGKWTVDRHSGRTGPHRVLCETEDETKARARFKKAKDDMRQGEVRLFNPEGSQADFAWAPRCRTRW